MTTLTILVYVLSIISFLCLIRVIIGPTHYDRLVAVNLLVVITTAIIAISAVRLKRQAYLDVALVYAILGYISVIAIAKYLVGKKLHKR